MEKSIVSKTTPLFYFRQYLTLINPLYNLTEKERNVLAYLLYLDYKYKDLPLGTRDKLIFDYDSKVEISNEFNIPMASVNNTITDLRKKSYLGESFILGKKLNYNIKLLPVLDNKRNTLTFTFEIVE